MKVALGSDHRGSQMAQALLQQLRAEGHEVTVLGECTGTMCDYPDVAWVVANAVW